MNKLLITTVVVFIIIGGILLSASVISENSETEADNQRTQIQTEIPQEAAPPVQNITADNEAISNLRENLDKTNTNYQNLFMRVENIEHAIRTLSDRVNSNSRDNGRTSRENSQELKCTMTGYTDAQGKPLSEAELKSPERLNDELKAGTKKVSLLCSY